MNGHEFCSKYLELINNEYSGINLTRITNIDEFKVKQYEDSIVPFEESSELIADANRVIDLGFGGGFPILPLATIYREKNFIGVEARLKKVKVVGEISNRLGIDNVSFVHSRFEEFAFSDGDLILSKAMASAYKILLGIDTQKSVKVALYKGPKFDSNEEEDVKKLHKDWQFLLRKSYKLSDGSMRNFVVYENVLRGTN